MKRKREPKNGLGLWDSLVCVSFMYSFVSDKLVRLCEQFNLISTVKSDDNFICHFADKFAQWIDSLHYFSQFPVGAWHHLLVKVTTLVSPLCVRDLQYLPIHSVPSQIRRYTLMGQ